MKRKQIIAYEGKKPTGKRKLTLIADIVSFDGDKYLIADLYSKKELIYREVYCSTGRFNYDYENQKADTKIYWNNPKRRMLKEAYTTDQTVATVKKYAKLIDTKYYSEDAVDILESIELKVDSMSDLRKKQRENDEKEKLFELLPEEPRILQMRIESKVNQGNIIYYKRHGIYADYHCCQCGEDYMLRTEPYEGIEPILTYPKPERLKAFECPKCGDSALLYPMGHAKCTYQNFTTFLYQVAADGTLITRMYDVFVTRTPEGARNIGTTEYERVFMRPGYCREYYRYNSEDKWRKDRNVALRNVIELIEVNYDCIKDSQMKYLPEDMYKTIYSTPERIERKYLARYETVESFARCPQLETLFKNDFRNICRRIIWQRGSTNQVNKHVKELHEILRITRTQLKCLKEGGKTETIGLQELEAFRQIADKYRIKERDYDMLFKLYMSSSQATLNYLLRFQSITKLWNIAHKYLEDDHFENLRQVLTEYKDYLREREDNGDDLSNTVYLKPRNLYETYTRIRLEAEQRKNEKYITEMQQKYSNIKSRSKKIPKKYTFTHEGLIIRPALDAKEIVLEGRMLHHCVGSDNQHYLKDFNAGKGWIMVIRDIKTPDTPYITVELKNDKIMQWYGEHDTKPDKEIIEEFLKEYKKHIDKKVRKTA
jgi:predicted RNA-binding Zn-ribbon protein involved in translation (DUF1610 family)